MSAVRKSADAWTAAQLPPEILRDEELLAQEYIARLAEDKDSTRVQEAYGKLKMQRTQPPAAGTFDGSDLDRLRLFLFPQQPISFKESFDAVTPSAVLRESALTTPSAATVESQLRKFQKTYLLQKTIALLGDAVTPDAPVPEAVAPYLVSAHEPSAFPAKLFSLASSRFQLDMLGYFRATAPGLFTSGMQSILGSLLDCPPLALETIVPHSAEAAVLNAHVEFAMGILADAGAAPSDTWFALALLIGLGESSGKLHPLLLALDFLLQPAHADFAASLPAHAEIAARLDQFVTRIEAYRVQFVLSLLTNETAAKRIHVLEELDVDDKSYNGLATDGKFVYGWSDASGAYKVGSGYQGAVAGKIYAESPSGAFTTAVFPGLDDAPWSDHIQSLVCVRGALYLGVVAKSKADDAAPYRLFPVDTATMEPSAAIAVATTATHVFSDGLALFTAEVAGSDLLLARCDVGEDAVSVIEQWRVTLGTDGQEFFRQGREFFYYTNGHEVVVTYRTVGPLHSLHVRLATGTVVVGNHGIDVDVRALCYDATNNLVWLASHNLEGKLLASFANQGIKAAAAVATPAPDTSAPIAHRILSQLGAVLGAYASDDTPVTRHAPFAVDLHEATFESLLAIVSHTGVATVADRSVLVTVLRVLLTNVRHWQVAQVPAAVGPLVAASSLAATLEQLIETAPDADLVGIAQELTVACLDLSHPTLQAQWAFLLQLLAAAYDGSLPVVQQPTVHLMLARLASHAKMQAFVAADLATSPEWIALVDVVVRLGPAADAFQLRLGQQVTQLLLASLQAAVGAYAAKRLPLEPFVAMVQRLLDAARAVCAVPDAGADADLDPEVQLAQLETTVLGQIAGIAASLLRTALEELPTAPEAAVLDGLVGALSGLVAAVAPLVARVPESETVTRVVQVTDASCSVESAHPIGANVHEGKMFTLPGATTMTITFDERSTTEGYYYGVTFYTDETCVSYHGDDRYYGTGESLHWPGLGNTPPLFIPSNSCYVYVNTEGTPGDFWGYKFTATAKEMRPVRALHWLTQLQEALLDCLGSIAARGWSDWCPVQGAEADHAALLQSELFRGGLRADNGADAASAFLDDLIELPEGCSAEAVAKALKAKTPQDQGAIPYINRAVRAVAAALLHHNGCAIDALALAQGLRGDPSAALLKAWRNAQKMRHWFHLGDAQPKAEGAKPTLRRQPSAYAGASDEALQVLCANVVARARFLLTLTPGTAPDSVSKKRWGALAKLARSHTGKSLDEASLMHKWHALVDEAKAATDLKELLKYRKSAAGRDPHIKTITELVLGFVQSDTNVDDVERAVAARSVRAHLRRIGLDAVRSVVGGAGSVSTTPALLDAFAATVQRTGPTVHVSNHLHGAEAVARAAVRSAFADVVARLAAALAAPVDDALALGALKVLAMDFEPRDADVLPAELVTRVFDLLLSPAPAVRHGAQATVRLWCDRFLGADSDAVSTLAPLLVSLLQRYVEQAAAQLLAPPPLHLTAQMLSLPLELLTSDIFTLPFAIFHEVLPVRPLKVGDRVKRGPHWNLFGDEALGMGEVGVVAKLDGTAAAVTWRIGDDVVGEVAKLGTPTFFKYNEDAQEIIPLDRDASGLVVAFENDTREVCRLHLNLSGHFELYAGADIVATSGVPLPPAAWHNVAVMRQESSLQVLVDNDVVLSHTLHDPLKTAVFGQTRLLQHKPAVAYVRLDPTDDTTDAPTAVDADVGLHVLGVLAATAQSAPQVLKPLATLKHVVALAFTEQSPLPARVAALHVLSSLMDVAMVAPAFEALGIGAGSIVEHATAALGRLLHPYDPEGLAASRLPDQDALWLAAAYASFVRKYADQAGVLTELATTTVTSLHRLADYATTNDADKRNAFAAVALLGGLHDGVAVGVTVQYKEPTNASSVARGVVAALDLVSSSAVVVPDGDVTKLEAVPLIDVAAAEAPAPADVAVLFAALDEEALLEGLQALLALRDALPLWLLDVRSRALKALQGMLSASSVAVLLPQWLALAQAPPVGPTPPTKNTALTFQSGHPYGNSIDAYQTVAIEGATALRITFDERCRTEHDYDYVKFYKDDSYSDVWGAPLYTGRDGSENWPGFGGREALEIPSNKCVLYWHSDSSGNDWGWKVQIEGVFGKQAPVASRWRFDQLQQRAFHLTDLLHRHNLSPDVLAPALPPPADDTTPQDWQLPHRFFAADDDGARFVVREVLLHEAPTADSAVVVAALPIDLLVTVLTTEGPWSHVRATVDDAVVEGWCVTRTDDTWNLITPTSPLAPINTTKLECVTEPYVIGPVTGLIKAADGDGLAAADLEAHFALKVAPADKAAVAPALADVLHNLTAQYARRCLRAATVEQDKPSARTFLQLCELFAFEKVDTEEANPTYVTQLQALARDEAFCADVAALALRRLDAAVAALPNSPVNYVHIEKTPPLEQRRVYFPGAKRLKVVFREDDTHIENTENFLRFYDSNGALVGEYTGTKDAGVWPGIGDVPPLIVDGDSLLFVNYVPSLVDPCIHAFKVYGEGFPGSDDDPASSVAGVEAAIRLNCWVLCLLAQTNALLPAVMATTSLSKFLDVLCHVYQLLPPSHQVRVLDVLIGLLQSEASAGALLAALSTEDVLALHAFLHTKMVLRHEIDRYYDEDRSPLMQRLVQCALAWDATLAAHGCRTGASYDALLATAPAWYEDVRDAMVMVDGLATGAPATTVQLTSDATEASIPGANKLRLVAAAGAAHAPTGVTAIDDAGARSTFTSEELAPALKLSELSLFTKVTRGFHWQYGDEDGGAGNVGVVVGIEPWSGMPATAVRVVWLASQATGLYRYGYRHTFDVNPVAAETAGAIIEGSSVTLVPPAAAPSFELRAGRELVIPDLPSLHGECTLHFWMRVAPLPDANRTRQCIFQLGHQGVWQLRLELNTKRQLVLAIESPASGELSKLEGPTVDEAKWLRIEVGTCSSVVALHVDGALSSHDRFSHKLSWRDAGPASLVFGRPFAGLTPSDAFVGHVDSIKIWNAPMHLASYAANDVFARHWESNGAIPKPAPSFDAFVAMAATPIDAPADAVTRAKLVTRNRSTTFPSLRLKGVSIAETCSATQVYYEVTLLDGNVNQIGWSSRDATCESAGVGTTGIGDTELSYAIDLARMQLWHGTEEPVTATPWTAGDVVGCLLDWAAGEMTFTLNGRLLSDTGFKRGDGDDWFANGPLYPSLSLSIDDGAIWNVGHLPFRHCPDGYVSVLVASGADAAVTFETFDFDHNAWCDVGVWHRLQPALLPTLVGAWTSSDVDGATVRDATGRAPALWVDATTDDTDAVPPAYPLATLQVLEVPPAPGVLPRGVSLAELAELVRFVNQLTATNGWSRAEVLGKAWTDVAPATPEELVKWPLLHQASTSVVSLEARFELLQKLNRGVQSHVLLYVGVEYSASYVPPIFAKLMAIRELLFGAVKQELWDREVAATSHYGNARTLVLNRPKASRYLDAPAPATASYRPLNPYALFLQAYQGMRTYRPAEFCSSNRLYTVTFLGENAIDAGGPYRETFSQFAAELQSTQLPLLLPTPNNHHNVGNNRDAFVLHPASHTLPLNAQLLVFLGKLLGVAIRTKEYVDLNLSQVVWKLLAHEPLGIDDLEAVDSLVVSSMRSIRHIDQDGITEDIFEDVIQETFATLSTDNRSVPIVPGGEAIAVTFTNRHAFADGVEQFRLHEYDDAAALVRQGLGLVVPLQLLRLFSWREVEMMVCGSPAIDVDLLEACTEYSCCDPKDAHVKWFWETLRAFSEESRRMFLKFVWGRIRLPRTKAEFSQLFKLQNNARDPPDTYLPVSHTCFFSLELPKYSTKEILTKRLMYAIYNCQAIDGDGDALAANQLGWED
ncbi:HECT E3 ubiquitin ligase [Achlya hypogyna]|uniref:HECT E3 ubiquitin ligase n=1 Tax=Achlya hypogyna TaxID=1202772 RepID=A0A1V9YKI1_ACHHY|nr:HECT E3 ubiquitin ligase [Achlya hypogyna]